MYTNFVAKLEADLNIISQQQNSNPHDLNLATKKEKIKTIIHSYLQLERQYAELHSMNSIY